MTPEREGQSKSKGGPMCPVAIFFNMSSRGLGEACEKNKIKRKLITQWRVLNA